MPLSEDEQRILHEIEQQFYESDPAFAREVGKSTLYRHAGRNLRWAAVAFVLGFGLLIFAFASSLALGFAGFVVMLAAGVVFVTNLRRMGKAGWQQVTGSIRSGNMQEYFGDLRKRVGRRFRRNDE